MLSKDFYDKVEQKNYLKYILYGDSISKDTKTVVQFDNDILRCLTFDEIWNRLSKTNNVIESNDKEVIIIENINGLETLSYDIKTDKLYLVRPDKIIRHKICRDLIRLNFTNYSHLDVTEEHSMLDYDPVNRTLKIKKPNDMDYAPRILIEFINALDKDYIIKFENKSLFYGKNRICDEEKDAHIFNIKPIKISNKEKIEYNDYVYDFSISETQNFVANGIIVHNTDSVFLYIPEKDVDKMPIEERIKKADDISDKINTSIQKYLNEYLLPKSNISTKYNSTFFKSEMIIDSIMFLDVKKTYAYKLLSKKGKIQKVPSVEYTGIQVVRSNASKLTQDLLRDIIENIIFNDELDNKDKLKLAAESTEKYYNYFIKCCDNFDLFDISMPAKWQKKIQFVSGMQLYNFIMKQEVFSLGSAGNFIYCKFNNLKKLNGLKLLNDYPVTKLNGICIPHEYDKNLLQEKMNDYQIEIDKTIQWDKLFTTTCNRIVDLIKKVSDK